MLGGDLVGVVLVGLGESLFDQGLPRNVAQLLDGVDLRSGNLALLLGVFIYILVIAIPILGWVIGIIATLLGLGAVWMVTKEQRTAAVEEAPPPSQLTEEAE